jgi:hypothetical protein
MENNNLEQSQNLLNYGNNNFPFINHNLGYLFLLLQDTTNQNLLNIPTFPFPPIPVGYIPSNIQPPFLNINSFQNNYPLYYNIDYNNIFQLNLLNPDKTISNNSNSIQNSNQQNSVLLNKKTNLNTKENMNLIEDTTNERIDSLPTDKKIYDAKSEIIDINNKEEKAINNSNFILEKENIDECNEQKCIKLDEKNETSTSILEEKQKENNEIPKKKKKRRVNYSELLYDPLLEQIGREKKPAISKEISSGEKEKNSKKDINSKKKETKKKSTKKNQNNPKQKPKTKVGKNSKKKQHNITLKNNKDILADLEENKEKENEENNPKMTRIIFHGNNYKETKNINDFMKYNFDFSIDEQYKTKKLITDYSQQHANINKIKENIYENYNNSEQHLDEIKNIWSREKFLGDNKELKNAINTIRDSFNERKNYMTEEKYLDIIKNNNYNISEFINKKNFQ